jgi:hypothetical protein
MLRGLQSASMEKWERVKTRLGIYRRPMYIISEVYPPAYRSPDVCRGHTMSRFFSSFGDARAHMCMDLEALVQTSPAQRRGVRFLAIITIAVPRGRYDSRTPNGKHHIAVCRSGNYSSSSLAVFNHKSICAVASQSVRILQLTRPL